LYGSEFKLSEAIVFWVEFKFWTPTSVVGGMFIVSGAITQDAIFSLATAQWALIPANASHVTCQTVASIGGLPFFRGKAHLVCTDQSKCLGGTGSNIKMLTLDKP
jgi:hypothetical protein